MTRVDFAFNAPDRLRAACAAARKRHQAGGLLVVYCGDGARLSAFDRLLWAFDDISFIPHVLVTDPLAADTPVLLTAADPAGALPGERLAQAWLLNLDDDCPPHYEGYARLLEVVSASPDERQAARRRWRDYQAAGHNLHSHDLSAS
jgi:DNA polymerase-3 subunit chi